MVEIEKGDRRTNQGYCREQRGFFGEMNQSKSNNKERQSESKKIQFTQNKQKGRKASLNKASMKKIKRKPVYKVGETKEIGI